MNYCINCGEKYVETAKFCTNCRTKNPNLVENSSARKNKRSPILIVGIALFLIILIYFALFYSKFSDIAGIWIEEEVPADEARIIISKDGNLSIIVDEVDGFEDTEISINYELEANGKDRYQTTDLSTVEFSVPEDSDLITMEYIQDEVLDGMFEGIVSDRNVKDGMVIYSMKVDENNTNSDITELAATIITIEYSENDLIDLTTVNSFSTETIQLNRIN